MRQIISLFLTSSLSIYLVSCNSQIATKNFYNENNYNTTKEIKSFDNKLFVLGQHFIKEDTVEHTTSILCLDTSLNKLWDNHFGNVKFNERFESFSIAKDGNIFIAGYNEYSKSAMLLKINQNGGVVWKKEFNKINSFNNLEIYNDSSIVIAGTIHFSDTGLFQDSSVIQKMDLNGNVIWTKVICIDNGLRFLKLANNKIIFCTNAGIYYGIYPNSKLFCLTQNGEIEWTYDLDLTNTAIDNGVKALNLKIEGQYIYALCQSHNMFNTAITLFKFDLLGQKINAYQIDLSNLPDKEKNKDRFFLFTGLNVAGNKKEPFQIILRKDKQNKPYFSSTSANTQLIDFTELNNKIYIIANKGELAKHYSEWQISKLDE